MTIPIVVINAFAEQPFMGNPAAVCLLDRPRPPYWLQEVARQINLPETAFLLSEQYGYYLRWFTPTREMELSGHATLASAHLLWERRLIPCDREARFFTRSGLLTAVQHGEFIQLDFPVEPPRTLTPTPDLEKAVGVPIINAGKNRHDYLVEVADEGTVRNLKPNLGALARLDCRGLIVTSRAESERYDYVSRYFAPQIGIPENTATGSAHCCLAPYWGKILWKSAMIGYQASGRGGIVRVELAGMRVKISGKAVTIQHCKLDRDLECSAPETSSTKAVNYNPGPARMQTGQAGKRPTP